MTYKLNLWGPIIKMTEAASHQAVVEGKRRLRDFLESSDTGRQAIAMSAAGAKGGHREEYEMSDLRGKSSGKSSNDDDDL